MSCVLFTTCLYAAPAIYQCQSADGRMLFTDTGCPPSTATDSAAGVSQAAPLVINKHTLNVADAPSAADAERAKVISRRLQAAHEARNKTTKQRSRALQRAQQHAKTLCREANDALSKLRELRRRGYSLKSHETLARQEQQHRKAKRRHC